MDTMHDVRLIDANALDEALREEYLSAVEQSAVLTARGSIIIDTAPTAARRWTEVRKDEK